MRLILLVVDGNYARNALVERDKGFGRDDALNLLNLIVELAHKVLVVDGVQFDEHRVGASREVAFNDFGDFHQPVRNALIH